MMKKIGFLMVGFLGLLFLGGGVFADVEYQTGYVSHFEMDSDGPVGDGWITTIGGGLNALVVSGGKLVRQYRDTRPYRTQGLLRPTNDNFRDGKIEVIVDFTDPNRASNDLIAIVARVNPTQTANQYDYYEIVFDQGMWYGYRFSDMVLPKSRNPPEYLYQLNHMSYPNFSGRVVKMELSMENQASSVVFGLKITDITTSQVLYSNSRTDTNVQALTGAGQWGVANHMFGTGRDIPILKVSNYNLIRTYSLKSNTKNITFGDTIMYTITAPETTVVSLSADKGGTFSPTNIELNEGNDYTATVDYTPTVPGLATITADFSTATSLTGEVFVRPYTTIIGFIGDSITAGAGSSGAAYNGVGQTILNLGTGFSAINRGAGGSNTLSWIENTCTQGPAIPNCMIAATGVFLNSGVDIISIMLGTNETRPVNDYKANMQTIIDILKNEGFKHVILNQLIYKPGGLSQLPLIQQYNTVLVDLVAENSGFVLLGDTQAYAATEAISGVGFYDGAHPNNTGYQKIGELWADAIRSALEYQINPTHQRSGNTTYQLTTSGTLTYSIDKRIGELIGVKVDGISLVSGTNYNIIASTGTLIELMETYLNTLTAGTKDLTIEFYGGVSISDTFTVISAPQCTNGATNYPTCNNNLTPPSGGSSGGGGSTTSSKDNCPNGDFSPSYYDGTCGNRMSENGEPENVGEGKQDNTSLEFSGDNSPTFSNEILTAYQRAYSHDITTLAPLEAANPDGTVIRGHLAKMVVNYALNALGRTLPEKIPAQCHRKDGSNAWESAEIKDYAVKACSLGLMGMDMDYFQPLLVVTRAQFGTVLSRLLRQNTYAGGKPYYMKHLQALKENGIMTQIDNPESRVELRQRVWLMLMRSSGK